MFTLYLLVFVVVSSLGLGLGLPHLAYKWDQLSGARSEKKLLAGVARIELEEEIAATKPTPEELAEAEKEIDAFLEDFN